MINKMIEISAILNRAGFECYLTGGALRDMLIGRKPNNYNLVTNAPLNKIDELFANDDKYEVDLGNYQYHIINGIELSRYKKNWYPSFYEYKQKIGIADSLIEDLSIRDLTINALAIEPKYLQSNNVLEHIIDKFGGLHDLEKRIIRFINKDTNKAIHDDVSRIIRAIRIAVVIEAKFEAKTLKAIRKNIEYLPLLTPNKIVRNETFKVMSAKYPSRFFFLLKDFGVLEEYFPSLANCYGIDGGSHHDEDIFLHNMIVGNNISPKYPLLRLAGFYHDVGKAETKTTYIYTATSSFIDHEKIGKLCAFKDFRNLEFSKTELKYICKVVELHMRKIHFGINSKTVENILNELNHTTVGIKDLIRLQLADKKGNLLSSNYSFGFIKQVLSMIKIPVVEIIEDENKLCVNGKDIMRIRHLEPGKEVGRILKRLKDILFSNPGFNNRNDLEWMIKHVV